VIVGTAGHIDHGKTTLVHALTGVDTDRLKEEKARGISIELGYAYVLLGNGRVLGFVDVPGHERLVHTMVAGACGIDFALLLIAADDGVMPQTREHVAILGLFGVRRGAIALTKVDRVSEGRALDVRAQATALLASTALSGSPLFPVNATAESDPGVLALRAHLSDVAADLPPRSDDGPFRLAIDRVFTLSGHGTVVAGTVFSGQVRTGDMLTVLPKNTPVRVRSIHAHNCPSEIGRVGERCALNLVGVDKSSVARGDWLTTPDLLSCATRADVRLHLLPGDRSPLLSGTLVHFHHGAARRLGRVLLLEDSAISNGQTGRAQMVLDLPICAMPGDRFIVRDAQASQTIGGGVILDSCAPSRKRRSPERLRYLTALERVVAGDGLLPLLREATQGIRISDLTHLTGQPPDSLEVPSEAIVIDAGCDRYLMLSSFWRSLRGRAMEALRKFHSEVPDEPGPDVGRLRRMASPKLNDALWRALVAELVREGAIVRSGPWLHLLEHAITLAPPEQALARKLRPLIATGRFNPPWVRDLAAVVHEPEDHVRRVLRKLVLQGDVYQVVRDLFYDRERIDELARLITSLALEHGTVEAARYRDVIGIGRKRAIQILEFFDRAGHTRRVRDAHVLRPDSGWQGASVAE